MNGPDPKANEENAVIWPELWDSFAPHRKRIFECLRCSATTPHSTLCVWGAGRTTDLDLIGLQKHFSKVDLVDQKPVRTRRALVQRGFDETKWVSVLPKMDLTGLTPAWQRFQKSSNLEDLDSIVETSRQTSLNLGTYSVVASTCVLSQILRHATTMIVNSTSDQAQADRVLPKILRALREQHLRLLLDHVQPGGFAILITDLTSSAALPELVDRNADLKELMKSVVTGNHFHGLNPMGIAKTLKQPPLTEYVEDVRMTAPWLWDSIEMQYLCMGFQIRKKR